ncbi:MAG: signal recognition particle receptor subunit alpha, partial [Synergistaceae bacterium]|nr:signal recognition particle receptor subunit alpha [Synergistaceae bacterium]
MAFFAKLKESLKGVKERWSSGIASLFTAEPFDESFWDELEERLIMGDVGGELSEKVAGDLKREAKKKNVLTKDALKDVFVSMISDRLSAVDGMGKPFDLDSETDKPPLVLLMIGVNGSGKTTAAGKLAAQFTKRGKKVVLAAADTFRAAAAEQLHIW